MNFHRAFLALALAAMRTVPSLAYDDGTYSYSSSSTSTTANGGMATTTISTPEKTQTTVSRGDGHTSRTVRFPAPPPRSNPNTGSFSVSSSSSVSTSGNGDSMSSSTVSTPGQTQTTITKGDGTYHTVGFPPPPPSSLTTTVFSSDFSSGRTSGFAFASDLFKRTNQPFYSRGSHHEIGDDNKGSLKIILGGIDQYKVHGMSGGWYRPIMLHRRARSVIVSFRYSVRLSQAMTGDNYVEILGRFGDNGLGSILKFHGGEGSVNRSGISTFRAEIGGPMEAGEHFLTLGAYLNSKFDSDEFARILFLDVKVEVIY